RRAGSSAWRRCRRQVVLPDHHVARAADDKQMLYIIAPNEDGASPAVDRRLVDDGEPRLASACRAAAEPSAGEPAHEPERQREQGQHYDYEEKDLETGLSFTEYRIQHHSSPLSRAHSALPEWLTSPLLRPAGQY